MFQFNFVGKLLGPKGNSLKRLQEDTMTKMAILGRGSMRDKQKVFLMCLSFHNIAMQQSSRKLSNKNIN